MANLKVITKKNDSTKFIGSGNNQTVSIFKINTLSVTVKEENILAALLAKTNIEADMYPAVVDAVRLAYIRHQSHYIPRYEVIYDL